MYTNLNLFLRAEYFAFCKTRFSLRPWTYVIFFTIVYWLMWIVIGFGRLLDRLLFRSFLCQEVGETCSSSPRHEAGQRFCKSCRRCMKSSTFMPSFTRPFSDQFSTSCVATALVS